MKKKFIFVGVVVVGNLLIQCFKELAKLLKKFFDEEYRLCFDFEYYINIWLTYGFPIFDFIH